MDNETVDVLAVIDEAAEILSSDGCTVAPVQEARAAVARLIAADMAFDAAELAALRHREKDGPVAAKMKLLAKAKAERADALRGVSA
jgi:hypothetical protein